MKTVIIVKPEVKIKVTLKEFNQLREKCIDNIMLNARNVFKFKKDKHLLDGVEELCECLKEADYHERTVRLIRGLQGFMVWSQSTMQKNSWAMSNIIHDLGEFRRNGHEDWFSPRTSSYDKFL